MTLLFPSRTGGEGQFPKHGSTPPPSGAMATFVQQLSRSRQQGAGRGGVWEFERKGNNPVHFSPCDEAPSEADSVSTNPHTYLASGRERLHSCPRTNPSAAMPAGELLMAILARAHPG